MLAVKLFSMILCLLVTAAVLRADDAWRNLYARLADAAAGEGQTVVSGRDDWLFLTAELRHMGAGPFWGEAAAAVTRATRPDAADPLPAILDFNRQLRDLGVQLLVVPVPARCAVYYDHLPDVQPSGDPPPFSGAHAEFYELLRAGDVRVLDLTGLFNSQRPEAAGPLYCRRDSHWSGEGCVMAAGAIARIIAGDLPPAPDMPITNVWTEISFRGDLAVMAGADGFEEETLRVRRVGRPGAAGLPAPLGDDERSPVILLGDSHNLVFHAGGDMYAVGAGLPDQLAWELGRPVELVAVRGSGATPARISLYRRAARNPEYWAGRKWVVWCFAVREFTESDGWRTVPVRPPAQ